MQTLLPHACATSGRPPEAKMAYTRAAARGCAIARRAEWSGQASNRDLDTAGNVGLMGAISSFDSTRGVRFESYAEMRIRGALLDELRAQDWLPRPWRHRIEQQKRSLERLRAELGREPYDEEVAQDLKMPLEEYEFLFGTALPGTPGGSMPSGEFDEDGGSALDGVADTRSDPPGEKLTRTELLRLPTT